MNKPNEETVKSILNLAHKDSGEAELCIYDDIGSAMWGFSAKDLVDAFATLPPNVKTVHVRINSYGGSVFEGTTIANFLKQRKEKIIVHVDGIAASIATIIMLAGDEVKISPNAYVMIHRPFLTCTGNAADLEARATTLLELERTMAKTYANKTGKSVLELQEMMAKETFFNAEDAVAYGLCDVIEEGNANVDMVAMLETGRKTFNNIPAAMLNCLEKEKERKQKQEELQHKNNKYIDSLKNSIDELLIQ